MSELLSEFFVDRDQRGLVRGGWFDSMGGMLVGFHAQEVCDILNAHFQNIENKTPLDQDGEGA